MKKLVGLILILLTVIVFATSYSCSSTVAQDIDTLAINSDTTIIFEIPDAEPISITFDLNLEETEESVVEVDKTQKIKKHKEIMPMEVDTTWQQKNIDSFEQLEEYWSS